MTSAPQTQEAGSHAQRALTASEYQLIARLLLNHIGPDPVRNDGLKYLAQCLLDLSVQAERERSSLKKNCGPLAGQVAHTTTPETGPPVLKVLQADEEWIQRSTFRMPLLLKNHH